MVIAQALGEYGMAATLVSLVSHAWTSARSFVLGVEPSTLVLVVCGLFLASYLWTRTH